ncbi:hypothetical protein PRUB_b1473 [Pseudoalteromonas rubra]|uniref:Phage abortive infection protein n=1 Tax=Pseudoalteromonas rubra TaxID=43658 RepID=A0A8T0C2H4_9GAMM|nr:hypothetical protein [Pseudoalteromonas rubra]KAF7782066.1 hypothetical protein PRUB_b1473 [Pseudoalteromonas rubra]
MTNGSKHANKQGNDWLAYFAIVVFVVAAIIVVYVYVGTFGIDLKNRDFELWESVAVYLNNILSPILLSATVFFVYKTWSTSRTELFETKTLIEKQVNQQRSSFQYELVMKKVTELKSLTQKNVSDELATEIAFAFDKKLCSLEPNKRIKMINQFFDANKIPYDLVAVKFMEVPFDDVPLNMEIRTRVFSLFHHLFKRQKWCDVLGAQNAYLRKHADFFIHLVRHPGQFDVAVQLALWNRSIEPIADKDMLERSIYLNINSIRRNLLSLDKAILDLVVDEVKDHFTTKELINLVHYFIDEQNVSETLEMLNLEKS